MNTKITIERECEHKIFMKHGLVVIFTVREFIHSIENLDKSVKYVSTNLSLINNDNGPVISKIGGSALTITEAYKLCIENFNRCVNYNKSENEILLCCKNIPKIELNDLQDFYLTRLIKFSWTNNENISCLLTTYVRQENDCYIFTYDSADEIFRANSDEEIIGFVLNNYNFQLQPDKLNNKRKGKLFYPTSREFAR